MRCSIYKVSKGSTYVQRGEYWDTVGWERVEAFDNVLARFHDVLVSPRCRDDLFGCELDHLVDDFCNLEGLADKAVHTGWKDEHKRDISAGRTSNRSGCNDGVPSIIWGSIDISAQASGFVSVSSDLLTLATCPARTFADTPMIGAQPDDQTSKH